MSYLSFWRDNILYVISESADCDQISAGCAATAGKQTRLTEPMWLCVQRWVRPKWYGESREERAWREEWQGDDSQLLFKERMSLLFPALCDFSRELMEPGSLPGKRRTAHTLVTSEGWCDLKRLDSGWRCTLTGVTTTTTIIIITVVTEHDRSLFQHRCHWSFN